MNKENSESLNLPEENFDSTYFEKVEEEKKKLMNQEIKETKEDIKRSIEEAEKVIENSNKLLEKIEKENSSHTEPLNNPINSEPTYSVPVSPPNSFTPVSSLKLKWTQEKKTIAFLSACLAVCLIILSIFIGVTVTKNEDSQIDDPVYESTITDDNSKEEVFIGDVDTTKPSDNENSNAIAVADKVRPSVVGVMTYSNGKLAGEGSGILWGEDKKNGYTYVTTCAHVITGSNLTYSVLLLDGKTYEAEMVATDTRTDIGVLKIKAKGLPLAKIGDSSSLKIGETIYAIGNPGGNEYFGSITDGIIASIDRSISSTYKMTVIQHNAAINPGNSGGALVNSAGQVIGINSSKIAATDFEGMGFAVPTSTAVSVVNNLINHGYVPNRPELGIQYASINQYQLYSMVVSIKELPKESIIIAGMSKDSSLAKTDAQVGDLIIAVNGKDMDDTSVLLDLIENGKVGDKLKLTLCRIDQNTYKTKTFDVTVKLIEAKGDTEEQTEETTSNPFGSSTPDSAEDLEDFFNEYFGNQFGFGFGW